MARHPVTTEQPLKGRGGVTVFTDDELLQLIGAGESDCVEFKEAVTEGVPAKIREAICAFANDLPNHKKPGVVFVGVKDDGEISELRVDEKLVNQLASMKSDGNIVPPPSMTVEKRTLHGKEIAVVIVQPSTSPPVRCSGVIHIRTGARRDIATEQDERILNEKRRHGNSPFDVQPIPTASLSDLNLHYFQGEYLRQAVADEILEANERSVEQQLAATKMVVATDEPLPTVLGILVIGKNPQDFLPGAYIQFLKLDGCELTDPILDNEDIRGHACRPTPSAGRKIEGTQHHRRGHHFGLERAQNFALPHRGVAANYSQRGDAPKLRRQQRSRSRHMVRRPHRSHQPRWRFR